MKIVDAENQQQWDDFVTSHADANFLQSWAWGDFHLARHKKVVRHIALDDKDSWNRKTWHLYGDCWRANPWLE